MEIQVRNGTKGWQGLLSLCTAAWLLVGCVTPALAGPGDLDMRFGDQGRLVVPGARQAVVQQPDGKLLFVNGESRLQIRRFNADGTPDTQFGQGGVMEVGELGVQARELQTVTAALQPDGKLLIGGSWATAEWGPPLVGLRFIARLDLARGGAPDPTFGKNGVVEEDSTEGYAKLLVLPQGDVIALGVDANGSNQTRNVYRYDATGAFLGGVEGQATDIAAMEGDAVVVLASVGDRYTLSRFQRAGQDMSFGTSGQVAGPDIRPQYIAVDGSRRIVVCGWELMRYTPTGQPDASFGPDGSGRVRPDLGSDEYWLGGCAGVAADASGQVLAIGSFDSSSAIVLRLRPDGSALAPWSGTFLHPNGSRFASWAPLRLDFTQQGDARIAWRRTGPSVKPSVVVEQIDLGSNTSSPSALGIDAFEALTSELHGSMRLRVIRSGGSGAANARFEVVRGTAGPQDATLSSGALSWAAGDTSSRELTIAINDDTLNEGDETISVRLYEGLGVAVPARPLSITIIDDEALRALRFENPSITWTQSDPPGLWPTPRVIRSAETPGPVTAHYLFMSDATFTNCCGGVVRWQQGSPVSEPITLPPEAKLGSSFVVRIFDDLGRGAEPTATVDVRLRSTAQPVTPPAPTPASGGGGGGGAFGLFDLLLIGLGCFLSLCAHRERHARLHGLLLGTAAVTAACFTQLAHAAPGDLDMRFGDQGRLVLAAATPGAPIAQQSDGKLVLVEGGTNLVVRRFNLDGTPDTQFGQGGRIEVPNKFDITPVAAALQPDGKLLVGGYRVDDFLATVLFPSFLIRLDGGNYDATFGNGGAVQTGNDDVFQEILLLPSGDILTLRGQYASFATAIDRIDATGRILSTVNSDFVFQGMAALDGDSAVVLNPEGMAPRLYLSRLQRSGFDSSFGGTSPGVTWLSGLLEHVAVDSQGRIVTCVGAEFRRYTAKGENDITFGPDNSGRAQYESIFGTRMDSCRGLAVDSTGRILAVGSDLSFPGSETRTFVIRLRADGSLDPTFNSGSGPAILRGRAPPTQEWQPLWLRYAPNGDARIAWRVRSGAPNRERVVVDAIDLGGNPAQPAVGIASYEPKAMERAGYVELPVVRSGSSAVAASVRYEVLSGSADATDVEVTSGTLDWAAGDGSRRTLRINLTNDTLNEGEERFSVRLRDGNGVAVPAEPTYITLVDDEALRSLRFDKETITWIQSPSAPSSSWPKLELKRPTDAAGPVTIYYYFVDRQDNVCCARGVRWEPGQVSSETIDLTQQFGLGNTFYAAVIDDEWEEVGPSATISAELESAPPINPTPPLNPPPPPPAGGGSGSSSRGGGGAFGWLDLLLIGLAAAWILRGELRRAATPVRRGPRPRPTRPSDNMAA